MHDLLRSIGTNTAFQSTAAPYLLLDTNLRIRAVNPAYLEATQQPRDKLLDEYLFDAFPDDPGNPEADGVRNLSASLERVLCGRRRDNMWVQRYDVPDPVEAGQFIRKTWSPVNSAILDADGRVVGALHHVEDITVLDEVMESGFGAVPVEAGDEDSLRRVKSLIHAATTYRHAWAKLDEENKQLHKALVSRSTIDEAKGIVMAHWGCEPDEAFQQLVRLSQDSNVPVREVAAAFVYHASRKAGAAARVPGLLSP